MWHLVEQRMRDAGRGETGSENVVREFRAVAQEELVKDEACKINSGNWRRPKRGFKREEWEVAKIREQRRCFWKMFF